MLDIVHSKSNFRVFAGASLVSSFLQLAPSAFTANTQLQFATLVFIDFPPTRGMLKKEKTHCHKLTSNRNAQTFMLAHKVMTGLHKTI